MKRKPYPSYLTGEQWDILFPCCRDYGYGRRSKEEDALDVWVIIDIEVLSQLDGKDVPLSAGRAQSFIAFNLRQLREAAKPAELVPHYSPGHPSLSGVPFVYDS